MELTGQYQIPADPNQVWQALNDPSVLRRCIPGCEALDWVSDQQLDGTIAAKIGPITARFDGSLTLADVNAPDAYTLIGEGKGGLAGLAKGSVRVTLRPDEDGTVLTYRGGAEVDGKLAQLGARLIQGTAQKYSDGFFNTLSDIIVERASVQPLEVKPEVHEQYVALAATIESLTQRVEELERQLEQAKAPINPWIWSSALITLVAILVLLFR